jgi:hypothetical protein
MLAILKRRCLCNRSSKSNVRLPSSKSISDIIVKPQALFYYCTYRNFTVFCSKYNFKSSECSQYYKALFYYCTYRNFTVFCSKYNFKCSQCSQYFYKDACSIDHPNQMWGCQVLKALVILLWNHKHCSITVPIGTLQFSAQNTILKAQNACNSMTKVSVESIIPVKCEVAKIWKH